MLIYLEIEYCFIQQNQDVLLICDIILLTTHMDTAQNSTIIYTPQTRIYFQPQKQSQPQSATQMLGTIKPILLKSVQTRSNIENKILNKFSKRSIFFNAIVEQTSPDVAKNLIKYAQIHQIGKNRVIVNKGSGIQNVVVMLKGRFGVVDNGVKDEEGGRDQTQIYKKIVENSLKVARDLKRKTKDTQETTGNTEFKTTKAAMYDIVINKYYEEEEAVFNILAMIEGKKYSETLISLTNCTIMVISSKVFYETLAAFVRKLKSDKISAFRKFQYFNCIENQRLIHMVDELPLITMKKGHFVYKQGQQLKHIYLLLKGSIKITKTVDLFKQNPNNFYLNRQKYDQKRLPFADFSQIYNYKPRNKLLQIGIANDMAIFGEEELFCKDGKRRVNAQVNSQTAVYYVIDLHKFQSNLPDIRTFIDDLKEGLFKDQTKKKILYRQQKLSELLICETKNNMDYFFIEDNPEVREPVKQESSPRKYKINKVNQFITPSKQQKPKQSSISQAVYNTFNFNKFPIRSTSNSDRIKSNKSFTQFTSAESKVIELVHSIGMRPTSSDSYYGEQSSEKKPKTARKHRSYVKKDISIDIHNPLFDIAYFHNNRKQSLRIQKESRMRPISTSQRSWMKPTSSRSMEGSHLF